MYRIFLIPSCVDGNLGFCFCFFFHVLDIVNNAAMNTGMHVSFSIKVLSRFMLRSGISGSYGFSIFTFLRILHIVFHRGCTNFHPHEWRRGFPFSLQLIHYFLFVDMLITAINAGLNFAWTFKHLCNSLTKTNKSFDCSSVMHFYCKRHGWEFCKPSVKVLWLP